jgi:uncharacterized protein (DUF2132 family)
MNKMDTKKSKDPLHGVNLQQIIEALVNYYNWPELGQLICIRCFNENPSISSSLNFLRRTPWARKKVENLYLNLLDMKKNDSKSR